MQKISTSAKQAIVEKALARDGRTLSEIAKTHTIGAVRQWSDSNLFC